MTFASETAYLSRMNNDEITTKPTIETVLEKMNLLGEQLTGQLGGLRSEVAELRTGQDELRSDVAELRGDVAALRAGQVELRNDIADLNAGQRQLVRRMEALNENILTLQADHRADMRGFDRRLERLESKSK